jgi:DNA-binding NarL/FixJ family response regulator
VVSRAVNRPPAGTSVSPKDGGDAARPPVPTRVLIVEDEALIAAELRIRLSRMGMTVVAIVDTAQRALDEAVRCQPDVVLMDIQLKDGGDGIETALQLRKVVDVPIVYVTAHSDQSTLERAKATSPDGYVLKPFHQADLAVAIELALDRHARDRRVNQEAAVPAAVAQPYEEDAQSRYRALTPRERDVFVRVVHGMPNKAIAAELGTTERTVKAHRSKVMRKMQVRSVAALTRLAALLGM